MTDNEFPLWTTATALAPGLLAILAVMLRLFIVPMKEFRAREKKIRLTLEERCSIGLCQLVDHARRIDPDEVLRGDTHNSIDLIDNYTTACSRLVTATQRLEFLRTWIRAFNNCMIAIAAAAILAGLFGAIVRQYREVIVHSAIVLTIMQVIVIVLYYAASIKLEDYEDLL